MIEAYLKENCKVVHLCERPLSVAVGVSCSSLHLYLFHLCAPWLLHGIQHGAGVHNSSESPLNTEVLTQGCPPVENVFNGHKMLFFHHILSLTFSALPFDECTQVSLHFNC